MNTNRVEQNGRVEHAFIDLGKSKKGMVYLCVHIYEKPVMNLVRVKIA